MNEKIVIVRGEDVNRHARRTGHNTVKTVDAYNTFVHLVGRPPVRDDPVILTWECGVCGMTLI